MVIYLTDFRIPLSFLLPYVLFYGGLLMLKAASKLRNFSFSLRFVFCLPPQAPLVLLIFVVQTLFEYWATLRMFFSLINAKKRRPTCRAPMRVWGIVYMELLSHWEVERVRMVETWLVREAVWLISQRWNNSLQSNAEVRSNSSLWTILNLSFLCQ